VILRVLTTEPDKASAFFAELKQEMQRNWAQEDVLIVVRDVETV
jgi:hypothetical protein